MKNRIVPHLSAAERKLIEYYRQSIPFARWIIMGHAEEMADESAKLRGPVPGNVLLFPRTEAAGRAGSDRIGEDKGDASPSRPDAS
jgi:hypothetical protein